MNKMKNTQIALGIALIFVGAGTMASAYHIDYDQIGPNPADEWATLTNPGVITLCESQGLTDKINANPTPNKGIGGLCFASSQDFATCAFTFLGGQNNTAIDGACTYEKNDEKDKKPDQEDDRTPIGLIEPKCTSTSDPDKTSTATCTSIKNETGVGQNWFIRIGGNSRSCNGAWNQTFFYKEVIAYYGGTAPNPTTGVSGHVTFFVNENNAFGTYDRFKNNTAGTTISTAAPDGSGIDAGKTATNCTGNGTGWGVADLDLAKPPGAK